MSDTPSIGRRRALALLGGGAMAVLVGCSSDDDDGVASGSTTTTPSTGASSGGCETIAEETAGPFPGNGTIGPNVLDQEGIVRKDIRSSFGSSTTRAEGVPMTVQLDLVDSTGCSPLVGAAVYLWHCDREGGYSLYSDGLEGENYLRGVQESDADGRVTFTSTFPGAYPGRWPHLHFEVYERLAAATGGGTSYATSQVAIPEEACNAVYETAGYETSRRDMTRTSLARDSVFADDGGESQLGTATGSASSGYTVTLRVPVNPDH